MNAAQALWISEKLVAWAIFLQALELLLLRQKTSDTGIWRWQSLKPEFGFLGTLLSPVMQGRGWLLVLIFQAVASGSVLAGWSTPVLLWSLAAAVLLGSMRFLGTFNGGADCMTLVILLSVAGAASFGATEPACRVTLGYIAFQSLLSYTVAGLVKLREPAWRNGTALGEFLKLPQYAVPTTLRLALSNPVYSRWIGYGVIVGELAIPLLLFTSFAPVALIGGVAFHLTNARVFGLNRFFWAWIASYPALYKMSL